MDLTSLTRLPETNAIGPIPFGQRIIQQGLADPAAPCILAPERNTASFQSLLTQVQYAADYLSELGFGPGDRLAVVLPNGPEMATAFIALSLICSCAPLNPAYSFEEFQYGLSDLKVKGLLSSFPADHPAKRAALALGLPLIDLTPDEAFAGAFHLRSSCEQIHRGHPGKVNTPTDEILVLHTSGTTSRPKTVSLTSENVTYSVQNIVATYSLQAQDRCLNMMPLFHIHGLVASLAASLVSGGSVICTSGFDPQQIIHWIHDLQPSWYTAVPAIHLAVLQSSKEKTAEILQNRLRFIRSCSSALDPTLASEIETFFSVPVLEAYGMTEAAHQIASNPLPPSAHKFGSVGLASQTVSLRIMDEKGVQLPPGKTGEVCIQGKNIIKKYANDPAGNKSNFFPGYLRTGDIGYLDPDGYLFIKGRLKELINKGGEKIAPREIDEVLMTHPSVDQAIAFPVPHPSLGEDIVAAVVLKPGAAISMQELREYASQRLVLYKVPSLVVFVTEIPKGPTGKVQRIHLAKRLEAELLGIRNSGKKLPRALTPYEAEIAEVWKEALHTREITLQDDFFALGGDSLKAAQIVMRLSNQYGVDLDIRDIFTYATIESMARRIRDRQRST